MSERKTPWTEGPWIIDGPKRMQIAGRVYRILDADDYPPSFVPAWDRPGPGEIHGTEEALANASLIAAAPEMADCLEENIDSIEHILADLSYHEGNDEIRSTLGAMRDDCEAVLAKARGGQ